MHQGQNNCNLHVSQLIHSFELMNDSGQKPHQRFGELENIFLDRCYLPERVIELTDIDLLVKHREIIFEPETGNDLIIFISKSKVIKVKVIG